MCGYILGFDINWSNWCWEQNFLTLSLVPPCGAGAHEGKACGRKTGLSSSSSLRKQMLGDLSR